MLLGAGLTTFPRIHAPYSCETVLGSQGTSKECLTLSWAMLLNGYVPEDVVSFTVDGDAVSVDFSTGVIESSPADGKLACGKGSAVYYSQMPSASTLLPLIYIYLDQTSRQFKIAASPLLLPGTHLHTLCKQLSLLILSNPTSTLTRALSYKPDVTVSSSMSDDGLSILNHPAQLLPGPALLHELLLRSPNAKPGGYSQQALDFLPSEGGIRQSFTYADLDKLSTNFAHRLLLQPGRGAIVPILLPQSPKLYIVLLGILKAGGAFAPLQLDAPVDRIKFVVGDVGAQVVVADPSFKSKVSWDGGPRVVFVDEGDIDIASAAKVVTEKKYITIHPHSPAYVMYTSGSTGTPKGVTTSHSAATQSLLAHEKHIPKYNRFLQFASPSFDVFVFEVFFTFHRGAALIGCDRSRMLSDIVDVINRMDVDALELTPTVLGELVVSRDRIPKVKVVLTIGEMLTRHIVDEFGDGLLHGMYGPTEAAVHCTVASNFRKGAAVGDTGIPFDTVSAFVLGPAVPGEDVSILPIGWVGELAVGGNQLADGYLNRPEQTEEAFVNTRYGRLYRTGDRARIHPGGTIECLGRISAGQVKFRGQRLELGEVEEAIRKIPGVKGAVASVISGNLVAFVGCEFHVTDTIVREAAKKWLPGYMIPNTVITMTEVPKLSSGKTDRKRLEKEFSGRHMEVGPGETDDSMNEVEKKLASTVMEVLKGVIISKETSFIASGLDSLLAIRMCSKLRGWGIVVQVADILRADCVKELAHFITSPPGQKFISTHHADPTEIFQEVRNAGQSKLVELTCDNFEDIKDIIPCTPLQEMMLAETMRDPTAYSNWILLELPTSYTDHAIELAFRKVVHRNEILRTGFLHIGEVSGMFAQIVWDSPREEQFTLAAKVEKGQHFDIDEIFTPPFRAHLVRGESCVNLSVHIHHALYDGWSWDHILRDFNKILMKDRCSLVPNRPQFREVVAYNLRRDESSLNESTSFWKEALADAPNSKLPNFYGYSGVKSETANKRLQLKVSRDSLERSARELGISPQVIIQTSWAYLLSMYLHSSDIIYGTVVSGRTIPLQGIEDIIGPCISTLPMRVVLGDKTKRCIEFMREIHHYNRLLLMYGDLDLRQIRKLCGVGSGEFDTLLIWQQTTLEGESEALNSIKQVDNIDRLGFSLLLEAEPSRDIITLKATYKTEILPPTQLSVLLFQLDYLVSSIVASPFITLNTLSSGLDESLLSIQNPKPTIPRLDHIPSLVDLVETMATERPDVIALEFAHEFSKNGLRKDRLTYSELNSASNALAHKLISMGVVTDELVCVYMEKSLILYISILAILKSGAAYLPLTPDTPILRVQKILSDAQVRICLATSDVNRKLDFSKVPEIITVDSLALDGFSSFNPNIEIDPSSLAYAVFTSGSTGIPKGVLISHKNIVTNIIELKEIYPYTASSKFLQFCSQAFDVSVFDIFFTWASGMSLCAGTKDILLQDLEGIINAFEITHLSLTPTVAALINPDNVPTVRMLVTAGEAITPKVFGNWAGRGLYQGYGPSETTNICTMNAAMTQQEHVNNLGLTLKNTSAFILALHDGFELVPRGGVGELCFGGSQVGRGYLNMPELTSKRFISHPKYGRIYRSGDLGRLLPDGSIQFIGREDDQVKIRGLRIELGEINSVLLQQELISDATTLTITVAETNSVLIVSFVVLRGCENNKEPFELLHHGSGISRAISEAFQTMSKHLAAYMIPTNIVPIPKFPMTSQGKIDKAELRRYYLAMDANALVPFSAQSSSEDNRSEVWTSTERALAKIIAQLAKVSLLKIEKSTSIFHLGLDSISTIYLSGQIGKMGYYRPEVSQIMQNPTVTGLAAFIDKHGVVNEHPRTKFVDHLEEFSTSVRAQVLYELGLTESEVTAILPCTHLQEAMLTERAGENAASYYNHTVFQLRADPDRLKRAWEIAMQRNEILRTCFCLTSNSRHAYAQVVLKEYSLPWTEDFVQDDKDLSLTVNQKVNIVSLGLTVVRPPLSFTLLRSPRRNVLLMSTHHSLYDGFAMDLLLEEVHMVYNGLPLSVRPSFSSVLQFIESRDLNEADQFWRGVMGGFQPVQFPDLTGKSNVHKANLTGMATRSMKSSRPLSDIENGCKSLSISLLALGQSVWARLLAVQTGEADICFGNVVSGRTIPVPDVENVIAPCFNTIPVRVQLTPSLTNSALMEMLQRANAEVMPFQLTPLRRIMATLHTEGQSLFDTLFILQYIRESPLDELWEVIDDRSEMDFAVVLEFKPNRRHDCIDFVLHFRRTTMDEEAAEIILRQLDQALCASIETPEAIIVDHTFLEKILLSTSNSPPIALPEATDTFLHSLLEQKARDDPAATALEFLDDEGRVSTYTYEAFNQAANQVAHVLLKYGVKRDEAIPICIEKSPQYYICVLGVLKAGSAFTPIDPSAPAQRKAFMLEELGARWVITNSTDIRDLPARDGLKFIILEEHDLCSYPVANPIIEDLLPTHLAYRLYTSGSTGLPKAVSVEIKSALQTIRASQSIIPWTRESRILQFAAITFDMCYYDCFMAWNYGFTLCSAGKKQLLGEIEGTINRMNITMLDLTPTVASTLIAQNLPKVELLYCIGEAMPQDLINEWGPRCVNSYGPTEAAMCCTIVPVDTRIKSANIGAPFPSVSLHILSQDSNYTLPRLGCGELCIGGPQIAREYHNNPQLTKSKFIMVGSERLYRTGDIARMLANGTFEFIGRLDDQVKIRGLRVELDEINHVIKNSHEEIKDTATIVLQHSVDTKEQLVSFLALEGRENQGAVPVVIEDLQLKAKLLSTARSAAEKALPTYMVPGVMLIIGHIPLSAAGKVDKKALKSLFSQQDIESLSESYTLDHTEQWTKEELEARDIIADISQFPADRISKASTIYQIGLDSISAAQVAMRLRKRGFIITVIDILECPSIKQLSPRLIHTTSGDKQDTELIALNPHLTTFAARFTSSLVAEFRLSTDQIVGVYPCTATQTGMLSQFLRTDGGLYFNHYLYELSPTTDIQPLRQAWTEVMEENEILRTGFFSIDDDQHSFATVIYSKKCVVLPWTLIRVDDAQRQSAIKQQKSLLATQSVHRLGHPPWHLTLVITGKTTQVLLSAHHALYDAQSLQMILDAVRSKYLGKALGIRPHFAGPLGKIVESALDGFKLDESQSFWLKQLEGNTISRFPSLTATRVRSRSSHVTAQSSAWKLSEIEAASQKLGYSIHAVAQAAWARILSTYLGEPQVVFGVVLSGRTGIPDAEDTVFPCLTTVPALSTVVGSNHDLVIRIQEGNIRVLPHQHTPLRLIQRWFDHPDQSFFDSIFVYQKTSLKVSYDEPPLWTTLDEDAYVDYTISIEVEPSENDSLMIRATCRDDIFPLEHSKILVQQLNAALIDILENPHGECTDFSHFQDELLSILPPVEREIPSDVMFAHQFVEKHCDLLPEKIALEFATSITKDRVEKQQWTYRQLDQEANKVANFLLRYSVRTGGLVGICFDKSAEASIAILGILKAGCGYVALDPTAPIDRKAFIVKDSGAQCILTMDRFADDLRRGVEVGVFVVGQDEKIQSSSIERPHPKGLTPSSLCYCLYTSGTTGTPKGCEVTHENTVQAILSFQRIFKGHWDGESRFLQFASFHFDVSVLEHFWSWSVGICLTSTPRDLLFEDLSLAISKLEITHLDLTPSLAALLDPEEVPSLLRGVFIVGGEALKQDVLDTWGKHGVLHNGYGPTEVTIGCTMLPQVPQDGKPSNIGPQFNNVGSFVMIPNTNRPTLKGAIGELCVSGKLVGKGYLNRPDLTEEKFPTLEKYGERIYRTGDLVRVLYNGCFDFLGRADDQVKLRGQRLEIGEINTTLKRADSNVKAAATLVLRHPKQQRDQLVSFFSVNGAGMEKRSSHLITTGEYSTLIGSLLNSCKRNLPIYMVPTHFLPLSEIPLSVNNKVDNKRLTQIYMDASLEVLQSLAYREKEGSLSAAEEKIQSILVEMTRLQRQDIRGTSTIFELGLDSVSVVGLARKLKKTGFNTATVSMIMQNSTIARLARALSEASNVNSNIANNFEDVRQNLLAFSSKNSFQVCEQLGVDQDKVQQILPCSALQEGMIFRFIDSDESPYFVSFAFELTSHTNIEKLKEAWITVIKSTDILRTCFCDTVDGYAQVVLKETTINWVSLGIAQDNQLEGLLEKEKNSLARLNRSLREPPIYFQVVRTPSRTILALYIFHGLYDGNSIPLILRDVEDAYNSKYQPRVCQFSDVVPHIMACDLKEAEIFWKKHLQAKQFLPFRRLDGRGQKGFTLQCPMAISGITVDEGCKQFGCTSQSLVQAAWATVLASYIGKEVTFGVVVSGRALPLDEIEGAIGPVFNTIPCFLRLTGSATWRELVKQAHSFNAESIPYHHTPLRLIRKWVSLSPGHEIFDSLFVYQRLSSGGGATTSQLWMPMQSKANVDFPVSVEIEQHSNGDLIITISALGDVLSEQQAFELISRTEGALLQLLKQPDSAPTAVEGSTAISCIPVIEAPQTNGYYGDFEWNPEGLEIRRTVAILTGLEESDVSENASIFELGLDSIEAIKLSARLRRSGIHVSVSTIMRNPTIRKLHAYLQEASIQAQKVSDDTSLFDFETQARKQFPEESFEAIYPTTPLQEAIIAETLTSNYKFYFNHVVLEIDNDVDLGRLQNAWKMVIQENAILRTSFFQVHEFGIVSPHAFGQVVHKKTEVPWTEISISLGEDVWQELQEAINHCVNAADLLQRPPLQLTVIKADKSRYLLLSISHALYDGWSIGLLHEDIRRAYHNSLVPRPSPIPLLENILKNNAEESSRFWEQLLQGAEISELPGLCDDRKTHVTHRNEIVSKTDYATAAAFCRRIGITVQTLGQTCWGLVLAHYLGRSDLVFGAVLSGRDTDDAEEIMFPSMTTVPVRVIAHGSYRTMLQYMQENNGNVLKHQHTPLRMIQKLVNTGGKRLFDTLFIYQPGQADSKVQSLYQSIQGYSDLEYNACVELEREDNKLAWRTACKSTAMTLEQVENMLQILDSLLSHIIESPDSPAVLYDNDMVRFGNTKLVQIHRHLTEGVAENSINETKATGHVKEDWCPFELKVRKVLSAIAQIPEAEIERSQTIFHLGLDSISAIRVSSELRKEGIWLGVAEILRNATIENISLAAAEKTKTGDAPAIAINTNQAIKNALIGIDTKSLLEKKGVSAENLELVMPATAGQIYMLSTWQNTNGSIFMPTFSFKAQPLAGERMKNAWQMLVKEESILRTTFVSTGMERVPILQVVFSEVEAQFEAVEMSITSKDYQDFVSSQVSQEQQKQVSLRSPPVRLRMINTGQESFLLLTIHHALYDGVSLPLLLKRLRKMYNSVPQVPKPTPPISWPSVVAYTSSRDRSKQEIFWSKYLDGAISTLLSCRSNPNQLGQKPKVRASIFNPTLFRNSSTLEEQCWKHGITLQSLFLASFSKIYAELLSPKPSSAQNIVIGIYLSNRLPINASTENHLYDLTAPTLNLLPLRVRRPKTTGLLTLGRRIQKDLAEINNADNSAGVSVADVERWTRREGFEGVKVDAWFNYLRLPGVEVDGTKDDMGTQDKDEDDSWIMLEEVKPVLPTTAAEAEKLCKPEKEQAKPFIFTPVGDDMLDTNLVRKHIMVSTITCPIKKRTKANIDIE
ncbi:hypothetical protein L211DRAFT_827739 [Terfezia boudieri ATCC MYA-4762]|uniref:Carrier domain-containing protein n=1 Tax=Terfezia boudieri ATCC MYA-4762 TaxID=1051890 RepID=A0A3N4LGE6_9PEZI|nr:hypothetical protein L211DRAFT_827739 [Terfezia boudieri ATCC MYA-4762]